MRVVLRHFYWARELKLFDSSARTFQETAGHSSKGAVGLFSDQDGGMYCLFALQNELHLFLDEVRTKIDAALTTEMTCMGYDRRFELHRRGMLIYSKTYPAKADTDGNPFWPSSPEDEDFLLWIHNIACSQERQRIFRDAWTRK